MARETVNKWALLAVVLLVSALFIAMIRQFLLAILLAGIFSGLATPMYRRLVHWFGERRGLASIATVVIIVFVVLIPLAALLGLITAQAVNVADTVEPWIRKQLSEPDALSRSLDSIPFIDSLEPFRKFILEKAGQIVGVVSGFLIERLSQFTLGTANLLLMTALMLYTMFFFLMDGDKLLNRILYLLPLKDADERRLLDKFTSVTRATLKGTAVVGIVQGGLAGLAFWFVGIPSSVFWGAMMAILSIIPGVGSALIWVPATIILGARGLYVEALALAVFCAVVVGSVDNLLRPKLVGRDTELHELMILFSTLGGIFMFGIPGIIIGPIIAALFVTLWDIYGTAFEHVLPPVGDTNEHEHKGD